MKQTLSFHSPIIASTQSKVDVEAFEKSTDAFEKGERLQSFYLLLDYIDPELRSKFGNCRRNGVCRASWFHYGLSEAGG